MNVAVAGGRGFIGRALAARLAETHTVAVWDLPEVNLLDRESVRRAVERDTPDLVVNLVAVLGGVQSKNLHQIFETNFLGNLNLVEACAAHSVTRYVFASSLTVHGSNPLGQPCTLDTPFRPQHAYGASKAGAEYSLMEYAKNFSMAVVALRPTLILGDTAVNHAPIDFLQTLLAGKPIELFGAGTHEREWLWIDDAVDGFARAVDLCARSAPGYASFFLGGQRIAMRDLAFKCAEHLGKGPEHVTFVDTRAQAFTLTCDAAESARVLGWTPRTDLDTMIRGLIDIVKGRRETR